MDKFISILFLVFLSFQTADTPRKPSGCLKADIMLVADMSTSVHGSESFIYNALKTFVDRFDLDDNGVRLGVVRFSDKAYLMTGLTSDRDTVYMALSSLKGGASGTTNMTDAVVVAGEELLGRGRIDAHRIIVLVSDGDPDREEDTLEAARQIKLFGVAICGIFVLSDSRASKEYMQQISNEYCYVESDYNNLVTELKKLEVCF